MSGMTQRAALGCALFLSGCSPFVAELLGRPCDNGGCVSGYQCSPVTNRCVRGLEIGCEPGQLCPDNITEGTACESNGSFIPCAGLGTDCSEGCRFCTDGTWSACDVSTYNPSDT